MKIAFKSFFLAALVLVCSCSKSSDADLVEPETPEESETYARMECDGLPYRMAETGPGSGRPILVMYLHGGSSKGEDNEIQLNEPAVENIRTFLAANGLSAIFIIPQCPSSDSWGAKMNSKLNVLLRKYESSCSSEYVLGGSMGGTGTWSLANTYPGRFAAIMPCAGKPGTALATNFTTTGVCSVMSEADAVMKGVYKDVVEFTDKINAAGGKARCDVIPESEGWSHADICENAYSDERLAWLFNIR